MLSKTSCCLLYYSSARNPINHTQDYQVRTVVGGRRSVCLPCSSSVCSISFQTANQDGWIAVVLRAESCGSVEHSLLCNFLSERIGRAVGCWWAQHGNLTSIICLSESVVAVCRTLSSRPVFVNPSNQPAGLHCFYRPS